MKLKKTLGLISATAALAVSATFAPAASAEISASAGVASQYLWRGFDLGNGSAAVYGDITYSVAGFHAGVWASSGDESAGHEYDLILGYGNEFGNFNFDVSLVSYVYPTGAGYTNGDTDLGEFVDLVLSFGAGPFGLTYYTTIEGEDEVWSDEDYFYLNLGLTFGDFTYSLGQHGEGVAGDDTPAHIQVDYAYNDNLTFTVSKFILDEDNVDKDMQLVVSYSIPIE